MSILRFPLHIVDHASHTCHLISIYGAFPQYSMMSRHVARGGDSRENTNPPKISEKF
jgi:hypothetical protein